MSDEKPKNAMDGAAIKEGRRNVKNAREDALNDLRILLNNPSGVRFLARLMDHCGLTKASLDSSGSFVYYQEGKRSIAIGLLDDLKLADTQAELKLLNAKGDLYVSSIG